MRNLFIEKFEKRMFPATKTHPSFRPGDTLCIHFKVEEAAKAASGKDKAKTAAKNKQDANAPKKYRIQLFEGVCLRVHKGGAGTTFTVRKIGANGVGVERVFPLHSPLIEQITLVSAGIVKRSRLYYLRDLIGKAARIRTRRLPEGTLMASVDIATTTPTATPST